MSVNMNMNRVSTMSTLTPEAAQQKLFEIFSDVDTDHNGRIDRTELQGALVNSDFSQFHSDTVKALIRLFDRSQSGSVDFQEFTFLWRYLADWRKLFAQFDADRSETINFVEFKAALLAFGYKLSPEFVHTLFHQFSNVPPAPAPAPAPAQAPMRPKPADAEHQMSFDMFVQACIVLKRITDSFKQFDTNRNGVITITFEDFLVASLRLL